MGRNTRPPGQSSTEPEALTFEAIYDDQARWVWQMVRRLGVPERWCEDATQEVFVVVLRRLPEYNPRRRLRGWLGAISAKVAANFRRREAKIPVVESIDEAEGSHASAVVAAVDLERETAGADELRRVLDELDPDQRLLLLLHHQDGVPIDELAEHLGVPEGTVKSRLARAREAFEAAWKRLQVRQGRSGANVVPLFGPWELLEADRQTPPLPDGVKERVWGNLQRIRAGGGGGEGGSPLPPSTGLAPTVARALSTKVVVTVGMLVAVVTGGAFVAGVVVGLAWDRPPATVPSGPQLAVTVPTALAPTAESMVPSAAPSASAPAPSASVAPTVAPTGGTVADLENVWMVRARSALAVGNVAAALAALQEHATRYHGGGQRAQERESLWIGTLLRAGRISEARGRFAGFERLYPQSPRLPEFREALAAP